MGLPDAKPFSNLDANAYVNRRSEQEIEAVLNAAAQAAGPVERDIPAATAAYAAGVEAGLTWAFGMSLDNPMEGH